MEHKFCYISIIEIKGGWNYAVSISFFFFGLTGVVWLQALAINSLRSWLVNSNSKVDYSGG